MIVVDYSKCCWKNGKCTSCSCSGPCKGCVEACPNGAITRLKKVIIDKSNCTECGLCIEACKRGAISRK